MRVRTRARGGGMHVEGYFGCVAWRSQGAVRLAFVFFLGGGGCTNSLEYSRSGWTGKGISTPTQGEAALLRSHVCCRKLQNGVCEPKKPHNP
jgi:hypothetical protein